MTDKENQNNDFIKEEIIKDLINDEKPTIDHCLGALDSNEKSDKVSYKTIDKLKHEKSHIEQNELSHSYVRKRYNNDVEIIAAVAGTDSKNKVNTKESQYVNLKEINQSSLYYQVKQDKMMLNSQLANMKRGTVFDLVEKNSRCKGQQVYEPFIKPKSKHALAKSQERRMISTSEQCHKRGANSIHESTGTQNPPTDIDGKSIRVENLVDSKMYENLKNVVKILGLNVDPNQMTASLFIKNEYDSELKNNGPPPAQYTIPPLPKDFVPPLPKQPLPLHPQEPRTQNVQFSCNVTLPSSTNAPIPNWYQNSYQQYQSVPGLVPYQPVDCCGINSQNSLLPSPFPTHNVTQNSYISAHASPVVYNPKPNSSHSNHLVPPHSDPRCSSCYHSSYTCNQNSNSQAHEVFSNSSQTKTTNITPEQNNNPFHREKYVSNSSEQFHNNFNHVKQNTYYYQSYKNGYPRYRKHSRKCDERRPRNDRLNEHKYHEMEKTDDCSFGKDRQSVREKYSYSVNMLRKQHVNEKVFVRSKSYTDFNSEKPHKGSREEVNKFKNINNSGKIRKDQSKYFNVNKLNSRERNEEFFNLNDKESYVSPLKDLYESSNDRNFQSISKHQPVSKQLKNKEVKKVLKNTSLKVHNNETLDNCKKISKLEQPDKNSCITHNIILKSNKNPQNTLTKKSVEGINPTYKNYGFNQSSQQSNKLYITETSSTVFDAESKLHNTVLLKNSAKPDPNEFIPNVKRIKYDEAILVPKKPNIQPNLVSNTLSSQFEDENSNGNAITESQHLLFKNTSSLKNSSNTSVVTKHKYIRKRIKVICSDSDCNSEMEEIKQSISGSDVHMEKNRPTNSSGVTRKRYGKKQFKDICSDSDCNNKIEEIKETNPDFDVQKEKNRHSKNTPGVARKKHLRKRVKTVCSESDSSSAVIKQSNPGSGVQKKKKLKKLPLSNFILRKPRKKVLQIVQECNNLDKNGSNNNLSRPKKILKFVNEADDINKNPKKMYNKVPAKKKAFTNYTLQHNSAEIVGDTNKTITNHESTETYDPLMSCQKDDDKDSIINETKVVNFSAIQKNYKQKLQKKTFNSLTDTGCKDNSERRENVEGCSTAGVIETLQNEVQLAGIGTDEASVSEDIPVTVIDKTVGETEANLPSKSSDTMRDLLENMTDKSKPEAVQALCQLLVSLSSNSQDNGNLIKRSLEIILEELKSKQDNQGKLITEPHNIEIGNDTRTMDENSNVEKQSSDNIGNKNAVGSSEVDVINSTKYSEGNAETEVGVELGSEAVPGLGQQDKVCFENTVCQESDILNKVIGKGCTSSKENRNKLAEKQGKNIKGKLTPENIRNEKKKSAERKCTMKGARELDSIHKALNSLPQYSDIMRSGGLRSCRMKNKCGNGFEGNDTSNPKKRRRSTRKTTPPKAIDLICNDSLKTSVLPSSNNGFRENVTQVDYCGSEEALTPKSASDTVSCSETSLVANQEINNADTHKDWSDSEIVDVCSVEEEENYSSIEIVNKEINEENECVNIAKDLLAGFEEDLTDKNHPSVIKHTENFFLGKN